MASRRPLGKKLFKSLLPILVVVVVAVLIALASIVYGITRPPRRGYLVTPQDFKQISGAALKVTDETWRNRDGSAARGWLLRGAEGAPAVVFLHQYGGDRSWLFNLGIKLNEATNSTILWPDLRGHGTNPPVRYTAFGTQEGDDLVAALEFLHSLKGDNQSPLVGNRAGVYGVELGAYAAMRGANQDPRIQVMVLDSVPGGPDELVNAAVREDVGVNNSPLLKLARAATRVFFVGRYANKTSCELAKGLNNQRMLLLAGSDDGYLRNSTIALRSCFPNPANLEVKTDLPLTGFKVASATGEQGEQYDRPVIDFFVKNLH
jgi:pimeloyl-ACP methyl ester carboxylesterase